MGKFVPPHQSKCHSLSWFLEDEWSRLIHILFHMVGTFFISFRTHVEMSSSVHQSWEVEPTGRCCDSSGLMNRIVLLYQGLLGVAWLLPSSAI